MVEPHRFLRAESSRFNRLTMAEGDEEPPKDDVAMGSSDEDEDYNPDADPDAPSDREDGGDAAVRTADDVPPDGGPALSITKMRAVDDAFLELFGYPYEAAAQTAGGRPGDGKKPLPAKRGRATARQVRILSSMFGTGACRRLVENAPAVAARASRTKPRGGGLVRLERRTVTEVKRFAGQEIRVEKVVVVPVFRGGGDGDAGPRRRGGEDGDGSAEAGASEEAGAASGAPPAGATRKAGVDDLLKEMSKPEKLSTMSKTSADWDLFKSKNADAELKEQLETSAAGNEAYLVKKDFLDRVDRRRFELEKAERDRERAQRGK